MTICGPSHAIQTQADKWSRCVLIRSGAFEYGLRRQSSAAPRATLCSTRLTWADFQRDNLPDWPSAHPPPWCVLYWPYL